MSKFLRALTLASWCSSALPIILPWIVDCLVGLERSGKSARVIRDGSATTDCTDTIHCLFRRLHGGNFLYGIARSNEDRVGICESPTTSVPFHKISYRYTSEIIMH